MEGKPVTDAAVNHRREIERLHRESLTASAEESREIGRQVDAANARYREEVKAERTGLPTE